MLALVRTIAKRQTRIQPSLVAGFSSSRPQNNSLAESDYEELTGILNDAAKSNPKSYSVRSGHNLPRTDTLQWKPFALNRPITPHKMTYKARAQGPRAPRKWPVLGPPSRESRYQDMFHQLDIDPTKEAQNPTLMAAFVSEMGKIYGRNVTNLTTKNQRKLGKAIRRAKMMGIIPILSRPGIEWFNPRLHS
jgi:small subunit ribosomal protein S18